MLTLSTSKTPTRVSKRVQKRKSAEKKKQRRKTEGLEKLNEIISALSSSSDGQGSNGSQVPCRSGAGGDEESSNDDDDDKNFINLISIELDSHEIICEPPKVGQPKPQPKFRLLIEPPLKFCGGVPYFILMNS